MKIITLEKPDREFGKYVAMDPTGRRFIAAAKHASYIYARSAEAHTGWVLEAKLARTGCVAIAGDVAVSGDTVYRRGADGSWNSVESLVVDVVVAVAAHGDLITCVNPDGEPSDPTNPPVTLLRNGVPVFDWAEPMPVFSLFNNDRLVLAMGDGIVIAGSSDSGPIGGVGTGTGMIWVFSQRKGHWAVHSALPHADTAVQYGAAVDVDDDFIIVGAPRAFARGAAKADGAAYLLKRGDLKLATEIAPPPHVTHFGRSVALRHGCAAIGGLKNGAGSLSYYVRAGGRWNGPLPSIPPSDHAVDDSFATSVSMSNVAKEPVVCIGAPQQNGNEGAVFVDDLAPLRERVLAPFVVELIELKCVQTTDDQGTPSDEPYAVFCTLDRSHGTPRGGMFRSPIFGSVESGPGHNPREASVAIWGPEGGPEPMPDPDEVFFLVGLMESDDGDADEVMKTAFKRTLAAAADLAAHDEHAAAAERLLHAFNAGLLAGADGGFAGSDDDRIGRVQELRIDLADLDHAIRGERRSRTLTFKTRGEAGIYELHFELRSLPATA